MVAEKTLFRAKLVRSSGGVFCVDFFGKKVYIASRKVRNSHHRLEMIIMLVEFRVKSQITIPKELVDRLGLSEGDKMEVYEKDGMICIMPVVVYPKKYIDELREKIEETKTKMASGEQPVFDNMDALFAKLEEN